MLDVKLRSDRILFLCNKSYLFYKFLALFLVQIMAKLLSVVIVWLVGSTVYGEKPRLDCHPDPSASEEKCSARGCIWDNSSEVVIFVL